LTSGVNQIPEVKFIGNRFLLNPEKFIGINTDSIRNYTLIENWKTSLLSEYSRQGFFWTFIAVETTKLNDRYQIIFNINENERAKISSVKILGNESIPIQKILPLVKTRIFFSESILASQIHTLLAYYENSGFPFVSIEPANFSINDSAKIISYSLKIIEGPMVLINNLKFTGTTISDTRIKQLIRFKPNTLYSENEKKKLLQKIEAQNFSITDYQVIIKDSTYTLQIGIKEKLNQELTGAVTYLPSYKELNGFFCLYLNNLLLSLRKVKLGWERYTQFTNYTFTYSDPYLLGFILSGNGAHTLYDTFYAKTDFNLNIETSLSDKFSLNFFIGYDRTTPSLENISTFQTFWLGQGLTFKNRENYRLDFSTALGTRKQISSSQIFSKTTIDGQVLFALDKNTNYMNELFIKNLYSNNELSISDSLFLGGTKTLRGYRENEFSTNRYLLVRNELSFLRNRIANLFLFGDFSWLHTLPHNLIKIGYGLGLFVKSKNTSAEISYGVPLQENLLKGKIHLKLSNNF
jgi:outer membrane protein assembly factor BamA